MMSLCVLFFGFALAETAAPTWYRAFVATGDGADPMTGCGCQNNAMCNKQASAAYQCGDPVSAAGVAGPTYVQADGCLKCRCDWNALTELFPRKQKGYCIDKNGKQYTIKEPLCAALKSEGYEWKFTTTCQDTEPYCNRDSGLCYKSLDYSGEGVSLISGEKCTVNHSGVPAVSWVANTEGNSAILGNSGGYPLEMGNICVGGQGDSDILDYHIYDMYMTWALKQDGRRLQSSSADPVGPKPTAGKWAAIDFQDPSGKQLKKQVVSIAIGRGLFNGQCQQCYIVQMPKEESGNQEDRYVALMQVDVRAWSLEFTQDSQCYLADSICYYGAAPYNPFCLIPNAMMVDCKDIVNNTIPSLKMIGVQKYSGDSPDVKTCAAAHDTCQSNIFM